MKRLLFLLTLYFFSIQANAGSCPDGSDPVKSISADGTYFVYNCASSSNSNKSSSSTNSSSTASSSTSSQSSKEIDRFGGISEIPEPANPNDETLKYYLFRYLYSFNKFPFCGPDNKQLHCEDSPPQYTHSIEPSNNPYQFQSDLREDKYIQKQMQDTALLSYLLYEDGKIVIDEITPKDRFGDMFRDSSKRPSQSVAKSLIGYVAGHAICKGYIDSVDSRLDDWPVLENTLYHNQKLIDVLNMAAGTQEYFIGNKFSNSNRSVTSPTVQDAMQNELKGSKKSDAIYNYNNFNPNIVGSYILYKIGDDNFQQLLDDVFKKKARVEGGAFFLKNELAKKDDISIWSQFFATRYDYLRIAKAMLDDWEKDNCVGKYLKTIHERRIPKNRKYFNEDRVGLPLGYAGFFHTNYKGMENRPVMGMDGYGGQTILIDFERGRIVATQAIHDNMKFPQPGGIDFKKISYERIKNSKPASNIKAPPEPVVDSQEIIKERNAAIETEKKAKEYWDNYYEAMDEKTQRVSYGGSEDGSIIFREDFENLDQRNLRVDDRDDQWYVKKGNNGNSMYCNKKATTDDYAAFNLGNQNWRDYSISYKIKFATSKGGELETHIRKKGNRQGEYRSVINSETGNTVLKFVKGADRVNTTIAKGSKAAIRDKWANVQLIASGNNIKYLVNNKVVASTKDDRVEKGAVMFAVTSKSELCIDDIVIKKEIQNIELSSKSVGQFNMKKLSENSNPKLGVFSTISNIFDVNQDGHDDLIVGNTNMNTDDRNQQNEFAKPVILFWDNNIKKYVVDDKVQKALPFMYYPRRIHGSINSKTGLTHLFIADTGFDLANYDYSKGLANLPPTCGGQNHLITYDPSSGKVSEIQLPKLYDFSHGITTSDLNGDQVADYVLFNSPFIKFPEKCSFNGKAFTNESYILYSNKKGGFDKVNLKLNYKGYGKAPVINAGIVVRNKNDVFLILGSEQPGDGIYALKQDSKTSFTETSRVNAPAIMSEDGIAGYYSEVIYADVDMDGSKEVVASINTHNWKGRYIQLLDFNNGELKDRSEDVVQLPLNVIKTGNNWCHHLFFTEKTSWNQPILTCTNLKPISQSEGYFYTWTQNKLQLAKINSKNLNQWIRRFYPVTIDQKTIFLGHEINDERKVNGFSFYDSIVLHIVEPSMSESELSVVKEKEKSIVKEEKEDKFKSEKTELFKNIKSSDTLDGYYSFTLVQSPMTQLGGGSLEINNGIVTITQDSQGIVKPSYASFEGRIDQNGDIKAIFYFHPCSGCEDKLVEFDGNLNKKKLSGKYNDFQIHFYLTGKKADVIKVKTKTVETKMVETKKVETSDSDPTVSKVIEVTHGDKLIVNIAEPHEIAGSNIKISLKDIDAPDATRSCPKQLELGVKVRDYVAQKLENASSIKLTNFRKTNTKIIAQVVVDGVDLGEELVSKGYASKEYGHWKPYFCSALSATNQADQYRDTDEKKAIFWYERSIILDPDGSKNQESHFLLSKMYSNFGNADKSLENLKKSASLEWVPAMEELGSSYLNGSLVKKDSNQGKKWLKKAFDKGSQRAEDIYCGSLPKAKQKTCKF